jgi:enoyl-CoA hydratase/carnithine racemase
VDYENLEVAIRDGVVWIRIDREARGNSLSRDTYAEIRTATRLAEVDDDVDVIVYTGTGRFFATGGDLDEAIGYIEAQDLLTLQEWFDITPFDTIQSSEKVSIAALNGMCMAGGLMLAKSCDIVVAADNVNFAIPEGRVGLADPWIPSFFRYAANPSLARLMMFSGKQFSTDEAMQIGIVGEVVAPDQLLARVEAMVGEIRQTTPWARRRYKRYLNAYRELISKEGMGQTYLEPDVIEGLRKAWGNRKHAAKG